MEEKNIRKVFGKRVIRRSESPMLDFGAIRGFCSTILKANKLCGFNENIMTAKKGIKCPPCVRMHYNTLKESAERAQALIDDKPIES